MPGEGPFLWLSKNGPPAGFWSLPPGGMCLSAFLFVKQGGKILLGKYADDPRWEELAGLDGDRRRAHGKGLTVPASHLKYGEDPRDAAKRVGEEVLGIGGMTYTEPRIEVDLYEPKRFSGRLHYDMWFLVDATLSKPHALAAPPWYAELGWYDPTTMPAGAYARGHEDVVSRWLEGQGPK
ncbi:MAG: NUDIX hydrolase [Methanobacteriota archaeon]|nr:MAG: NUDIX hydrolase [Euryarchaeota archaeon]